MSAAATSTRWMTPPQVADELGVDVHKILKWIDAGELAAVNVAENCFGRPRYRISSGSLEQFLAGRVTTKTPKMKRRRKANSYVPKYYQ